MEIRSLPTGIMVYITIKKRRMTGAEDAIHAGKRATHAKTFAFSKFCDSFWVKMEGNRKSQEFEMKELFGMKKDWYTKFVRAARNRILHGGGAFLMALAVIFAAAPCSAHFYEPEVPRKLQ